MAKATLCISRINGTKEINLNIVDRENNKSYNIFISAEEYGLAISGLVNTNNCRIEERNLTKK